MAEKAHAGQKRESGAPYFEHPAEVAMILARIHMDAVSVIAALLHDTVEDTALSLNDIRQAFGEEVAFLVRSVTRLTRVSRAPHEENQPGTFHALMIAMSRDLRALLIKLADRLHNMRTLEHVSSPEKRQRVARQTMDIFVPLAGRVGIEAFRDEMQDIATRVLRPELYQMISERTEALMRDHQLDVNLMAGHLQEVLARHQVEAVVLGRCKAPHSLIEKMERKNITFEQVYDLFAFRVIVDRRSTCYQVLGILHEAYQLLPGRFKDYIAAPRANGYQSIHAGVIGPLNQKMEIQIRTQAMDDVASYGVAAHWWYKSAGETLPVPQGAGWLRQILEQQAHADDPDEALAGSCMEISLSDVFCLTPDHRVVVLPSGSTCVDFAYAVHTWLGDHCTQAFVNGREMPLRTRLAHGDVVRIVPGEEMTVCPEWGHFVVTGHARERVRRAERRASVVRGRRLLEAELAGRGLHADDHRLSSHLTALGCETMDMLWRKLDQGLLPLWDVLVLAWPEQTWDQTVPHPCRSLPPAVRDGLFVPVDPGALSPRCQLRVAPCCYPLRGDKIWGVRVSPHRVRVHRDDCQKLSPESTRTTPLIPLRWHTRKTGKMTGQVYVRVMNYPGYLADTVQAVSVHKANISHIDLQKKNPEAFDFMIDVEVADLQQLQDVMTSLRACKTVCAVERPGTRAGGR